MSEVHRGTSGAAIAITFTIIASLTLAARIFTRKVLVKQAGYEELAIIFAWVRIALSITECRTASQSASYLLS